VKIAALERTVDLRRDQFSGRAAAAIDGSLLAAADYIKDVGYGSVTDECVE
jgi:hypothetical protein